VLIGQGGAAGVGKGCDANDLLQSSQLRYAAKMRISPDFSRDQQTGGDLV